MGDRRALLLEPRGIRRIASTADCCSSSRSNSLEGEIGLSFGEEHLKDFPSSIISTEKAKRRLSPHPTLLNPPPSPYRSLAMKKSKTVDDFSTFDVAIQSYNVSSRVETELVPFLKGFKLAGGEDVDRSSSFGSVDRTLSSLEENAESQPNNRSDADDEEDECWGLEYTF